MNFPLVLQAALQLLCPDWVEPPSSCEYPQEIVESSKSGLSDCKDAKFGLYEEMDRFINSHGNPLDRPVMPIIIPIPPPVIRPCPVTNVDP